MRRKAKVFWTGRSQAVRLPQEFRFEGDTVFVRREGNSVILEPVDDWPEGWIESFVDPDNDLERPPQGVLEVREPLE